MVLTCAHKFHKYSIDGYAKVLKQQEGDDEMPLRCPICKEGRIPSYADDVPVATLVDLTLGQDGE